MGSVAEVWKKKRIQMLSAIQVDWQTYVIRAIWAGKGRREDESL